MAKISKKSVKSRSKLTKPSKIKKPKSTLTPSRKSPKPKSSKMKEVLPEIKTAVKPQEAYLASEESFYQTPSPSYANQPQQENWEPPTGYGDNRIILLTRDPYWLYTYWEISHERKELARQELGDTYSKCRLILRVYDVTDIVFTGYNALSFFDIDIYQEAGNWYINVNKPGNSFCVDIGLLTPDNSFILLARSNIVKTPLDRPSNVVDEEWMVMSEDFQKLYALSALGTGSSPVGIKRKLAQRLQMELSSGAISSISSPMRKKEKIFYLVVNTELIVYGATEPDAQVTVQNRPVKLNQDGTFSLRFALPNGKQVIPVKAVSQGKKEERSITPIVSKETK